MGPPGTANGRIRARKVGKIYSYRPSVLPRQIRKMPIFRRNLKKVSFRLLLPVHFGPFLTPLNFFFPTGIHYRLFEKLENAETNDSVSFVFRVDASEL